jgi:hypothetical protein
MECLLNPSYNVLRGNPLGKYCDVPLGLYIVRGDNIVFLGEIDESKDDTEEFKRISPDELAELEEIELVGKIDLDQEI